MKLVIAGMAHPHVSYFLEELAHHPGLELVATADPDRHNREQWTPSGVPTYADHREAFGNHAPDIVAGCGIYSGRGSMVMDALSAGAHVIIDKPLCTSLDEMELIRSAAASAERHVSVVFEKRWYPVTMTVRRLVREGLLGEIKLIASTGPHKLNASTRPRWFLEPETYGHILGDLPVHDIDLVLEMTGASSGRVMGHALKTHDEYPEWYGAGALLLETGQMAATIDAHWIWPAASAVHGRYQMRITGTRGVAEIDWADGTLTVETNDREIWSPELDVGLRPAQQAFTALMTGDVPEVDTHASLAATEVALLAAASAHSGNPASWSITGWPGSWSAQD